MPIWCFKSPWSQCDDINVLFSYFFPFLPPPPPSGLTHWATLIQKGNGNMNDKLLLLHGFGQQTNALILFFMSTHKIIQIKLMHTNNFTAFPMKPNSSNYAEGKGRVQID